MSQQSLRQASVRAISGTTLNHEGDWHAMWTLQGIAAGTFNERMLSYINTKLLTSYTELNGAMYALAADQGATSFQALGTFDADITAIEEETATLIVAMSPAPNSARRTRIDTLVAALKAGGVWQRLDLLYIEAAHNTQAAKLNWITPASNTLAIVGSVAFATDAGYTGDGSTGYMTTGYIPNTHGVNFILDDASIGAWSNTNAQSSSPMMGARTTSGTGQAFFTARNSSDVASIRLNQDAAGPTPSNSDSSGFFIFQRTANNVANLYRNDVAIGAASTSVSTTRPTAALVLLALNTGGTVGSFSAYQTAVHFIGGSLTAGQRTAFYDALTAYMTGLATDYP